jgi:hypothetical protein
MLLLSGAIPAGTGAGAGAGAGAATDAGDGAMKPSPFTANPISLQQAVAVGCTNPARLYGIYPKKGKVRSRVRVRVRLNPNPPNVSAPRAIGVHDVV